MAMGTDPHMDCHRVTKSGGAAEVHTLVGLAPSNHGTSIDGLTSPVHVPCVPVLPITGPGGWVPSF